MNTPKSTEIDFNTTNAQEEQPPQYASNTVEAAENVLKNIQSVKQKPISIDVSCNTEWLPSFASIIVVATTFMLSIGIVYVANLMKKNFKNRTEFLLVLPLIVSFSGSIGVNAMTRTLLIWNDKCFNHFHSKVKWFIQQVIRSVIIGVVIGTIAYTILVYFLRFPTVLGKTIFVTLLTVINVSTILGVILPLIIRYFLNAPQFTGNAVLLLNDILATIIYFTFGGMFLM